MESQYFLECTMKNLIHPFFDFINRHFHYSWIFANLILYIFSLGVEMIIQTLDCIRGL